MKHTTEELLNLLNRSHDIKQFMEHQQENIAIDRLADYLNSLLSEKSLVLSECIRRSGLDRTYCYQIFAGTKNPSRDKLLALCFAMKLTAEDVQNLLKSTGYPVLYLRIPRDSIIYFALEHNYSLDELNECLADMEFELVK